MQEPIKKPLARNIEQGGIIACDIDNYECWLADPSDAFNLEESHQIHLARDLSNDEAIKLQELIPGFGWDGDHLDEPKHPEFQLWLNCMALSEEARAYLESLKA